MDFGCTQATSPRCLETASVAGDFGVFGSLDFLSPEHIQGDSLTHLGRLQPGHLSLPLELRATTLEGDKPSAT